MPDKFSRTKVAQLLIESINSSRVEYDELNETMLSDAPEYFITVNSVKRLSEKFSYTNVTMEWSVKSALDEIKNKSRKKWKKPGKPYAGLRKEGRFDIVLWDDDDMPWGIIELKKGIWTTKQYEEDIKRIRATLKTAQTIKENHELNGFLAFYLERQDNKNKSKTTDKKILDFVNNMKGTVEDKLDNDLHFRLESGEFMRYKGKQKDWGFRAFCFVIYN